MKFNNYGDENRELHNTENIESNTNSSLFKKVIKSISKILVGAWIMLGIYFISNMLTDTYDEGVKTISLGVGTILIFPAAMYLITSSKIYKSLKEKYYKLTNIKVILASIVIAIIANVVVGNVVYNNMSGVITILIICIPGSIVSSVIGIILHCRKQKLRKALERNFSNKAEFGYEKNELYNIENMLAKCKDCGYENKEGAKFCNQCGATLEQNHNENNSASEIIKERKTTLKNLILGKHKKARVISLIVAVIFSICYIGYFNYGIGMPEHQKNNRINNLVSAKKYNEARSMNDRYFKGTDKVTTLTHDLHKNVIDTCEITNTGNLEEAMNRYNELKDLVKIIKTKIVSPKYSSDYKTIQITVQNNSKENLNYVKIGLDFKDSSGKIIQSDWTNNDSVIKPGATQTLEKMVSKNIKFDTVHSEVLDFK